jgi:hypothetical protein
MKNDKPKFTPGPWKVEKHDGKTEIWSASHFVATTYHALFYSAEKHGLEPQNANLLAAAPDMFEALRCFIEGFDEKKNGKDTRQKYLGKAIILGEYALAKARGES